MGKTQHTVAMDRNLENYDFGLKDANVKILKKILTMSLKGPSIKCMNAVQMSLYTNRMDVFTLQTAQIWPRNEKTRKKTGLLWHC